METNLLHRLISKCIEDIYKSDIYKSDYKDYKIISSRKII